MFATIAEAQRFVGQQVTARRQKSGMSTRELADAVGLSYVTVYRVERGDYPLHTPAAEKVVFHFLSIDDLLVAFAHQQIRECPELKGLTAKFLAIQPKPASTSNQE